MHRTNDISGESSGNDARIASIARVRISGWSSIRPSKSYNSFINTKPSIHWSIANIKSNSIAFNCLKDVFNGLVINEIPQILPMLPIQPMFTPGHWTDGCSGVIPNCCWGWWRGHKFVTGVVVREPFIQLVRMLASEYGWVTGRLVKLWRYMLRPKRFQDIV